MMALLFALVVATPAPVLSVHTLFPLEEPEKVWTQEMVKELAIEKAEEYGLTVRQTSRMLKTISCESGWIATSTSPTGDYGVVQINAKAHPKISKEQMFDPEWSIEWMIKHWKLGHYNMWVCYTRLYGQTSM